MSKNEKKGKKGKKGKHWKPGDKVNTVKRENSLKSAAINFVEQKACKAMPQVVKTLQDLEKKAESPQKPLKELVEEEIQKELDKKKQQQIGYVFYCDFYIDNFLVIAGGGRNGKTTLFGILESFYGKENISGVSLQDLNYRPFALHKLYGKMANISDDLSAKAVRDSGIIKKITNAMMAISN